MRQEMLASAPSQRGDRDLMGKIGDLRARMAWAVAAEVGWRWRTGEENLGIHDTCKRALEPCRDSAVGTEQEQVRSGTTCDSHVMQVAALRWQRGKALTFRVSEG
jgi:hypothetical protein